MSDFDLFLFSVEVSRIEAAVKAGIRGVIVDWEERGKRVRQLGADTEVNHHTVEDLRRVRAATGAAVFCRINAVGPDTEEEVDLAIDGGADEILVPMVRTAGDVSTVLSLVRGRVAVGILLETLDALAAAQELARLPLSRVYVGLNDLSIERGTSNIFISLVDGVVEQLRGQFKIPFGFGGMTVPSLGSPIPCRLLIGELARLECAFTFLRRSFHRDVPIRSIRWAVPSMFEAVAAARARSQHEVQRDRESLISAIRGWNSPLAVPPQHDEILAR